MTGITTIGAAHIIIEDCDFINNYSYGGGSNYIYKYKILLKLIIFFLFF